MLFHLQIISRLGFTGDRQYGRQALNYVNCERSISTGETCTSRKPKPRLLLVLVLVSV